MCALASGSLSPSELSPSASVGDFRLRAKKSSTARCKIALRVEVSGGSDPPDGNVELAAGGTDPPGDGPDPPDRNYVELAGGGPDPPGGGPDPPDCPDLPGCGSDPLGGGPDPP